MSTGRERDPYACTPRADPSDIAYAEARAIPSGGPSSWREVRSVGLGVCRTRDCGSSWRWASSNSCSATSLEREDGGERNDLTGDGAAVRRPGHRAA